MDSQIAEGFWKDFFYNAASPEKQRAAEKFLDRQRLHRQRLRQQKTQAGVERKAQSQDDNQWATVKITPEQHAVLQKFERAFENQLNQFLKDLKVEIASKRPKFQEAWKQLKNDAGNFWRGIKEPFTGRESVELPIELYKTLREEFNLIEAGFEGPLEMPHIKNSPAYKDMNYAGQDIDEMLTKFRNKVMKSFSSNLQQVARRILQPHPQNPWTRGLANLHQQQLNQPPPPNSPPAQAQPVPQQPNPSPPPGMAKKPGRALDQWNDDWMIHKDHTETRKELTNLLI